MFEAGWALLEQIKIDTFPYCFLKCGSTCVPAVTTARAAPLPPGIPKPGHFSGVPEILGHITDTMGSLPAVGYFFASGFRIAA